MKKKNIPPLPKKEDKKNNRMIAEIVLAALIIFWSVCSVLGVIAFARTCDNDNSVKVVNASADEIEQSSLDIVQNYALPIPTYYDGIGYPRASTSSKYALNFPTFYYDLRYGCFTDYAVNGNNQGILLPLSADSDNFPYGAVVLNSNNAINLSAHFLYSYVPQVITADYVTYIRTNVSIISGQYNDIEIQYTIFFNDGTIDIEIVRIVGSAPLTFSGDSRVYYPYGYDLNPLPYTVYMPLSYDNGYFDGFDDGETQGYNNGYYAGDNAGYNRGYNAGVADSNEYSFNGLITSVIDVPIKAFTGLFNFEILGVNLSGFFFALLTVCVVLTVAKLFI